MGWRKTLLDFAGALFAIALAGESFFRAALLTWFQVKRVPLDFLHNIFLLDLTFKAAQRTFKSFALLQMDFGQSGIHHLPVTFSSLARQPLLCRLKFRSSGKFPFQQRIGGKKGARVEQVREDSTAKKRKGGDVARH